MHSLTYEPQYCKTFTFISEIGSNNKYIRVWAYFIFFIPHISTHNRKNIYKEHHLKNRTTIIITKRKITKKKIYIVIIVITIVTKTITTKWRNLQT